MSKARDLLPACFILFTALLVWPLLTIANRRMLVGGVPLLVLYLFVVWAAMVAVVAWTARRSPPEEGA